MNGHLYGETEPTATCPYCGYDKCHADFTDIGVGYQQTGPYGCDNCHAVEIGPNDDDATEPEKKVGWYAPPIASGVPFDGRKS